MGLASYTTIFQAIVAEGTDYTKKSVETRLALVEKLVGAKSLETVIQIQTEYAKAAYAAFVAHATKMGEPRQRASPLKCRSPTRAWGLRAERFPVKWTHLIGKGSRLRLDSGRTRSPACSAVFHQHQGSRRSPNSPAHGLVTGADCDRAKGHVSLVSYSLAVLARGACSEADLLP